MLNPISQNFPTPNYKFLSAKFFCLIFFCVFGAEFSYGATINISGSSSVATSTLSDGDGVSFTGSSGILNVNSDRTLSMVNSTTLGFGHINFNSANILTIEDSTAYTRAGTVAFNADGTLLAKSAGVYTDTGVTTASDNSGNIILAGSVQYLIGDIGSSSNKLKSITVNSSAYYTEFGGDIYTHTFAANQEILFKSYEGAINIDLGSLTIAADRLVSLSGDINLINFNSSGAGKIQLAYSSNEQNFTFTGNALINSGLEFIFYNDGDTVGNMSKFVAAGSNSITVANGITIDFFVYDSSKNIPLNTDYLLIDASASGSSLIIDTSKINVTTNSLLANFVLKAQDNKLYVSNSELNYSNLQKLGDHNSSVATAVFNNSGFSGSNMGTVRTNMLAISDLSQLKKAVETLSTSRNSVAQVASTQTTNKITNIISSRISSFGNKSSGFSSGDSAKAVYGIWGEVFGGKAKQGALDNQEGYKSNSTGFVFGADSAIDINDNINSLFGASLAYGQTSINSLNAGNQRTDTSSYQLSLYNNNSKTDGLGLYNENILNLGFNNYKTTRNIAVGSFNATANGKFNGTQHGLKTGFGYNIKTSEKLLITPNAAISYYRINQQDYSETGAGNIGLNIDNKALDTFSSNIGLKFTSKFKFSDKEIFPKLDLSWIHNLKKEGQVGSSSFIAGGDRISFTSNGMLKDTFNIGTELSILSGDSSSISLRYDLQTGHELSSHMGNIKYRFMF